MTIQERPRGKVVEYPTSDGKPMAESDIHLQVAFYVLGALQDHFLGQTVYVAGNNFLYYEEGNPRACVSPDTYVVFGVTSALRDCYKAWEEAGRLPNVVFEFTSRSTQEIDLGRKHRLYERKLRVPEYFLFDPRGDYLHPPLQGFRLKEGVYVSMEPVRGRLHSEQLGLDLVQEGRLLRFWDPRAERWLPSREEIRDQREMEAQRADEEAQRAEAERQRAEAEAAARAAAQLRAEAEAQRAEAERQRADQAETELARLRAELAALRGPVQEDPGDDERGTPAPEAGALSDLGWKADGGDGLPSGSDGLPH